MLLIARSLFTVATLALLLDGCSGMQGASPPFSSAPTLRASQHFRFVGAEPDTKRDAKTCPLSQYYWCFEVAPSAPITGYVCAYINSTCLTGGTWGYAAYLLNGQPTNQVGVFFTPNPGNPTFMTFWTSDFNNSRGALKYYILVTYTNGSINFVARVGLSINKFTAPELWNGFWFLPGGHNTTIRMPTAWGPNNRHAPAPASPTSFIRALTSNERHAPPPVNPTSFTIGFWGNLANALYPFQQLNTGIDPFCPPSSVCYPSIVYSPLTNTTFVTYSGSALYQAGPRYHFGLIQGGGAIGKKPVLTVVAVQWGYSSKAPQSPVSEPFISVADTTVCTTATKCKWDVVYLETSFSGPVNPSNPGNGSWYALPVTGKSQPKFTFLNYTSQEIYIGNSGILTGQSIPNSQACDQLPSCSSDDAFLDEMDFAGMPPPEDPDSPFKPMTYPPPSSLNPTATPGPGKPACSSTGGVSVSPCPVKLTSSQPTQTVTVTYDPAGTITETDTCAGIATLTEQPSGGSWIVSAGLKTGTCAATFNDFSGNIFVGAATLPITNTAKPTGALLYVPDYGNGSVEVYNYKSGSEVGAATGFEYPYGACSDKNGDVYVVDYDASTISEFAYGSTTVERTLSDGTGYPTGCSVNPKNGDLAVTNFYDYGSQGGGVLIYANASGTPTFYPGVAYYNWTAGYDPNGNLWMEGEHGGCSAVCLQELRSGGSSFGQISFNQTIDYAAAVQWDGKYLGLGDQEMGGLDQFGIYQATVSGTSVTSVNTVTFTDSCDGSNTDAIGWAGYSQKPNDLPTTEITQAAFGNLWCENRFDVYDYPAGGSPIQQISGPEYGISPTLVIK